MDVVDKILSYEDIVEKEIEKERYAIEKSSNKYRLQLETEFEIFKQSTIQESQDLIERSKNETLQKYDRIISESEQDAKTISFSYLKSKIISNIEKELIK